MDRRQLSRLLALFGGLLIGGALTFLSGSAHARSAFTTNVTSIATAKAGPNGVWRTGVVFNDAAAVTNVAGGGVSIASNGVVNLGRGAGAVVPISVPVAVSQTLSPGNIASAIIGSGGNVPLTVLQLAAPALLAAGIQYYDDYWGVVPSTDSDSLVTPAINVPGGTPQVTYYFKNGPYGGRGDTHLQACLSSLAGHHLDGPNCHASNNYFLGTVGDYYFCPSNPNIFVSPTATCNPVPVTCPEIFGPRKT